MTGKWKTISFFTHSDKRYIFFIYKKTGINFKIEKIFILNAIRPLESSKQNSLHCHERISDFNFGLLDMEA